MKTLILAIILLSASSLASAQNLTPAQKEADFRYLASLYSTYYAPLDWKKQLFGFDALNITPWLERVAKTTTDLDFYEICVEYVASLNDAHDRFSLPSDFVARLGFSADIYDGVVLIDSINRAMLPQDTYPFEIGDELVSVDGRDVQELIAEFAKYAPWGNPVAVRRLAAARITIRPQATMPHAVSVGDSAMVVIRGRDGGEETYIIPWTKTGTPLEVGPVPSPARSETKQASLSSPGDYMAEIERARFSGILRPERVGVVGFGSRSPIFVGALPLFNFSRRLGGRSSDFFYSGTFPFEGLTIGYIRIPNYGPASSAVALQQFDQEIAFMNANTDGLIVDEMRNPGGSLCFGEEIAARLIPYRFQATGFQLRPFWSRIIAFYNAMIGAKQNGAPQSIIEQYEIVYNEMLAANTQGRLVTNSLPLCTSSLIRNPATGAAGNVIAYQKPIIMLIDEFSTSTADSVPAMIQDAGRGLLYGTRTAGAGGNNADIDAGSYTEGVTGMTLALQTRRNLIGTADFPTTRYIENVGVRPDFEADYMTRDDLFQNGAPFLTGVLYHMVEYIRQQPR